MEPRAGGSRRVAHEPDAADAPESLGNGRTHDRRDLHHAALLDPHGPDRPRPLRPGVAPSSPARTRPLLRVRLRPPRHAGPLPRVRPHARRSDRVRRRLLNLLTALSLLLCVVAAAMWVRSYSLW